MNNKKKVIIAIIILLFLGLTIFAFANNAGKDDDNGTRNVISNNTTNSNTVNNTTTEDESTNNTAPAVKVVDDSYDKALKAVQNAESKLDQDSYDSAKELVNKVTDQNKKEELEERLEEVEKAIDAKTLVEELKEKTNSAESKDDMDKARDFREDNEVPAKVEALTNAELKEELQKELEEIAKILDDKTAPEINIDDEAILNEDTVVEITDDNEFTATLVKDGKEVPFASGDTLSDGEYSLTVVDAAFNEISITFTIDTIAPTVVSFTQEATNVSYANMNLSMVTATVVFSEKVQLSSNNWSSDDQITYTRTFSRSRTGNLSFSDIAGNQGTYSYEIDATAPRANVSYNPTSATNQDVVATITANEDVQDIEGWTKVDARTFTKTYSENTNESVTVKDIVGNKATVNVRVTNIDKVAPTATVTYSTTELTNGDVTVTISTDERIQAIDGWRRVRLTRYTKVYSENTTETVIITDLAGNTAEVEVSITNIDKVAPTLSIRYSTTEPTNQYVTAILTADEDIRDINGWTKVDSKTFINTYLDNVSETITVQDIAGNSSSIDVVIENIDKVLPEVESFTATVTSSNNWFKMITATIVFSEKVSVSTSGWGGWSSNDQITYTRVFMSSQTGTINFTDLAGNANTYDYEIDATNPTVTVGYSETNPTNQDVTATITANEKIQDVEGWTRVDDLTISKVYSENTTETVTVMDLTGNKATANVAISNIDKDSPTATVSYSETNPTNLSVIATITASEKLQAIDGWLTQDNIVFTKTFEANASETVTIFDLVGNTAEVGVVVANIDKDSPVVSVSYNPSILTNGSVTVTLTSSEKLQAIDGWLTQDNIVFTKDYNANTNGTETLTVYDLAGNSFDVEITVSNIDSVEPTATVSYSNTNLTNQNVTAILTASEEIQPLDGWTTTDNVIFTKEYEANVEETLTMTDLAGNTGSVSIVISNIDKAAPEVVNVVNEAVIEQGPGAGGPGAGGPGAVGPGAGGPGAGNTKIKVTLTFSEEVTITGPGWQSVNDDRTTWTHTFPNDHAKTINFSDDAGNTNSYEVKPDITAPIVSTSYSTTELTNQDVTVTLTSNEELQTMDGWTKVEVPAGYVYTKEYSANTSETLTVKDLGGNSTDVDIVITNIDKTAPTATVSYSKTNPTNQNVMATITSDKDLQDIDGWTKVDARTFTKEYDGNVNETETITDLLGNTGSVDIVIENIDKVAPTVINIERTTINNGGFGGNTYRVTFTFSEPIATISEVGSSTNNFVKVSDTEYYRDYHSNSNRTVNFTDTAGNSNSVSFRPRS